MSDPLYVKRINLIMDDKDANWVNSLGAVELNFIYDIWLEKQKELEKLSKR